MTNFCGRVLHVRQAQLHAVSAQIADMSNLDVREVDPPVVLLSQFDVVGSENILLSQHCNNKSLKEDLYMCECCTLDLVHFH